MKHAYLIIANRNYKQLQMLITMIDDSRNDIYLIIDKKSENCPYNFHTDYSTLNYVKPLNIYWGSYSLVDAELRLFSAASDSHYEYYHLLSGLDMPLFNQDYIHSFFDKHPDKEFIGYGNYNDHRKMNDNIYARLRHHFFRKHFRSQGIIARVYRGLERRILQYCTKPPIPNSRIGYASQWLTIDDKLVQLIVKNKSWIKKIFKYSFCPDELFIPTLINFHKSFLSKVYYNDAYNQSLVGFQGNLRFIKFKNYTDWSPSVWRINDYQLLKRIKNKGYLFSRKFDSKIDINIVNKLFNSVMK